MLLLSVAITGKAFAQTPEEGARQAFEKGLADEAAGRGAEACESFRRSLSLVRELGPLRKSTDCDIKDGRLIAARSALDELISRWPRAGAELEALKQERASVGARIAKLTLTLQPGAVATVRVDGKSVPLPSTTELDPGEHEIAVDEASKPVNRIAVHLKEGQVRTLTLPEEPVAPVETPSAGPSGLLIGGIIGVSLGGLGLIGAGVTGGLVLAKDADHEACDPTTCAELAEEGDTLLSANTALWIVGLATGAVGATLLIVEAASGSVAEVTVGPASASFTLRF